MAWYDQSWLGAAQDWVGKNVVEPATQAVGSRLAPAWDAMVTQPAEKAQDAWNRFAQNPTVDTKLGVPMPNVAGAYEAYGKTAAAATGQPYIESWEDMANQAPWMMGQIGPLYRGGSRKYAPIPGNPLGQLDDRFLRQGEGGAVRGPGHYLTEGWDIADRYAKGFGWDNPTLVSPRNFDVGKKVDAVRYKNPPDPALTSWSYVYPEEGIRKRDIETVFKNSPTKEKVADKLLGASREPHPMKTIERELKDDIYFTKQELKKASNPETKEELQKLLEDLQKQQSVLKHWRHTGVKLGNESNRFIHEGVLFKGQKPEEYAHKVIDYFEPLPERTQKNLKEALANHGFSERERDVIVSPHSTIEGVELGIRGILKNNRPGDAEGKATMIEDTIRSVFRNADISAVRFPAGEVTGGANRHADKWSNYVVYQPKDFTVEKRYEFGPKMDLRTAYSKGIYGEKALHPDLPIKRIVTNK